MIYLSPDPYSDAFGQPLDLRKFNIATHATAGLSLLKFDGRLHLATMSPSTPAVKMKDWRARVKGAWLIKIGTVDVSTIKEAKLHSNLSKPPAIHQLPSCLHIQRFDQTYPTMDYQSSHWPSSLKPHTTSSTTAGNSPPSPITSAHAVLPTLLLNQAASTMSSRRS